MSLDQRKKDIKLAQLFDLKKISFQKTKFGSIFQRISTLEQPVTLKGRKLAPKIRRKQVIVEGKFEIYV